MRGEKLRVWFAPEDMQGGQKLIEQIDRAIQVNDRLLLVLSEHSMNSEWVQTEIRKARQAELVFGAGLPTPPLGWTVGLNALDGRSVREAISRHEHNRFLSHGNP